jgi:hypothetical protein
VNIRDASVNSLSSQLDTDIACQCVLVGIRDISGKIGELKRYSHVNA